MKMLVELAPGREIGAYWVTAAKGLSGNTLQRGVEICPDLCSVLVRKQRRGPLPPWGP